MGMALPAAFLSLSSFPAVAQGAKPNPSDLDRVKPGLAAPAFTLPDAQGKGRALSSFRGTPTVLVFYRGYW
jgi:cytochrome oxidase Cu insertion factor (SCO1/SenC/PrrC family)